MGVSFALVILSDDVVLFLRRLRVYLGALQCGLCQNSRGMFLAVNAGGKHGKKYQTFRYDHHKIYRHINGRDHRKHVQLQVPVKFDFSE